VSKLGSNWYSEKVEEVKKAKEKVDRFLGHTPCNCGDSVGFINTHTYEYCKNCWGVITYKEEVLPDELRKD
jgi:hypothetical protein